MRHILLVHPNAELRSALCELLQLEGYRVTSVAYYKAIATMPVLYDLVVHAPAEEDQTAQKAVHHAIQPRWHAMAPHLVIRDHAQDTNIVPLSRQIRFAPSTIRISALLRIIGEMLAAAQPHHQHKI